jgi:hypothetical protein
MTGTIDILGKEKEITGVVVKKLRSAVREQISKTSEAKSGQAIKTGGAGSRFKNGRLQRITLSAPHYIFKQHYGFEGKKSNGVNQRLKGTNVFEKALDSANVLEDLANQISELRIDQVTALIQFKK